MLVVSNMQVKSEVNQSQVYFKKGPRIFPWVDY